MLFAWVGGCLSSRTTVVPGVVAIMSEEHAELVSRLRGGDIEALAEYLELRRRPLLAFIDRQLGAALHGKLEAEDVLQEVSADAMRALPAIGGSQRDPFSWLRQIAERRIIDAHRRYVTAQKRSAAREVPLSAPASPGSNNGLIDLLAVSMTTASQAFSRNQRELRLLQALEQLPKDQREALRLRYVEGMPSKEIATRLGKSDGAIRVMLSRSLDRLKTLLGPEDAPR